MWLPFLTRVTNTNRRTTVQSHYTSLVCKTAEHIINSKIIQHLDDHNLLTESQFGFKKKRLCDSQLLIMVDDLARGFTWQATDRRSPFRLPQGLRPCAAWRPPSEAPSLEGQRSTTLLDLGFSIRTYPAVHFRREKEQCHQCHIRGTPRHCIGVPVVLSLHQWPARVCFIKYTSLRWWRPSVFNVDQSSLKKTSLSLKKIFSVFRSGKRSGLCPSMLINVKC